MRFASICIVALALNVSAASAQSRCFDTGYSIHCPPGCVLLKPPYFRGDYFTWRCRRPAPPPVMQYYAPPPPLCPSGTYSVGGGLCCPIGTLLSREGMCQQPEPYRPSYNPPVYRAAGGGAPNPVMLVILALIGLGIWGAISSHAANKVRHRDVDDLTDMEETEAARKSLQRAAIEADEIIRKFKDRAYRDGREDGA